LSSTCASRSGVARVTIELFVSATSAIPCWDGRRQPHHHALAHDGCRVGRHRRSRSCVSPRESEQAVDHLRQPLDLAEPTVEVAVLEAQPQRRERCAELVRRVGDELLLRAQHALERCDSLVEDGRK